MKFIYRSHKTHNIQYYASSAQSENSTSTRDDEENEEKKKTKKTRESNDKNWKDYSRATTIVLLSAHAKRQTPLAHYIHNIHIVADNAIRMGHLSNHIYGMAMRYGIDEMTCVAVLNATLNRLHYDYRGILKYIQQCTKYAMQ